MKALDIVYWHQDYMCKGFLGEDKPLHKLKERFDHTGSVTYEKTLRRKRVINEENCQNIP